MSRENTSTAPALDRVIQILRMLKPYLYERWGVTELAVFGSVARGESEIGSDVDLLSRKAIRPRTWDLIKDEVCYV